MILQGRVTVNGRRAGLGDKADPATDDIRVDGERLHIQEARIYIIINKPMQVVTTVRAQEQEKRQTVRELVPVEGYLYPVGRLDADSEGLVLLTNDGELAQRLTHPRYHAAKVYNVVVQGRITDEALLIWRRGVMLEEGKTQPVEIKVLERGTKDTTLQITMQEGRKRQIRRIALRLGFPVRRLVRTHLATLSLGELQPGEWRHLTETEVAALKTSTGSMKAVPARVPRSQRPTGKREGPPRPAQRERAERREAQAREAGEYPERPPRRPRVSPLKPGQTPRKPGPHAKRRPVSRRGPGPARNPSGSNDGPTSGPPSGATSGPVPASSDKSSSKPRPQPSPAGKTGNRPTARPSGSPSGRSTSRPPKRMPKRPGARRRDDDR